MAMRTAGRPASPTIHPRTKPEANEFASKNRSTGDWFRHDGKNVEDAQPPPQRLQGHVAPEFAEKNKGEPEQWYEHNAKNPPDPQPNPRVPSNEAKHTREKVEGKEEAWFKMEDNKDYHSPHPAPRVTTVQGKECLEKLGKANTNTWYRHEHGKDDPYNPPVNKSRSGPLPNENKKKLQGTGKGAQKWYQHDAKKAAAEAAEEPRPHSRVHTADAQEYLDRNRGSAGDWYQHSNKVSAAPDTPRGSGAGAAKTNDSENWFSHDANKNFTPEKPAPKVKHPVAQEMAEKGRGKSMEKTLTGTPEPSESKPARVKPEANSIAKKNVQGMMDKYLSQEANAGYQSARRGGRVVKSEASANATRNRGTLSENLGGGYNAPPPAKRDAPRIKPEAAQYANRNKGSMNTIIGGAPQSSSPRPASRLRPEAEANKDRNKGQGLSSLIGSYGNLGMDAQPNPRVGSASARAAADRNKGSIGGLLGMG